VGLSLTGALETKVDEGTSSRGVGEACATLSSPELVQLFEDYTGEFYEYSYVFGGERLGVVTEKMGDLAMRSCWSLPAQCGYKFPFCSRNVLFFLT
jgi:hypothetical protein